MPGDAPVRLLPAQGAGRPISRAITLAICFGALVAVIGLVGLAQGPDGGMGALSWILLTLGVLLSAAGLALLALFRRDAKPASLSPNGIEHPRRGLVPWSEVDRCEIRRSEDGTPLLAARLRTNTEPLWLGAVPANTEQELLQQIDRWTRRRS